MRSYQDSAMKWGEEMQELNGFIKLYRKLKRWGWYKDTVVKCVFLHFLLSASYTEFEWMGETFKPGQLITSIAHLSEELGFSSKQIRTAIDKLCSTKEVGKRTTNKYTVITVMNWESYQGDDIPKGKHLGTPTANEGQTDGKQRANEGQHIKNNKNIKNIKNKKNSNRARAIPLLSEILLFISENGLNVDGEKFYAHYTKAQWKTAEGKPIDDWKSLLRTWHSKEMKPAPTYPNGYAGIKNLADD